MGPPNRVGFLSSAVSVCVCRILRQFTASERSWLAVKTSASGPGPRLKGRWNYLEHNWEAVEGSYVFEPPGEIHTLVVPDGVEEMITLFHVTGSLLYCDVDGTVVGADDVFSKLQLAKKHYAAVGLGEEFVQQFVR